MRLTLRPMTNHNNYNHGQQSSSIVVSSVSCVQSNTADPAQFHPHRRRNNLESMHRPQSLSRAHPGTMGLILTIWPCSCNNPPCVRRTPTTCGYVPRLDVQICGTFNRYCCTTIYQMIPPTPTPNLFLLPTKLCSLPPIDALLV